MTRVKKQIGEVGVDSGQLFITDPCYLDRWGSDEYDDERIKAMKKSGQSNYDYSGCCAVTLSEDRAGNVGGGSLGVALSTGYGDGCYPVIATFENGVLIKVEISFE